MEKENFLGKLRKLVELAKSKQNALDVTEINNFFMGDNLQTEQMEQIYNYLEQNNIDVIPEVIDDSILKENDSMLDDDVDDEFLKNEEEDLSLIHIFWLPPNSPSSDQSTSSSDCTVSFEVRNLNTHSFSPSL